MQTSTILLRCVFWFFLSLSVTTIAEELSDQGGQIGKENEIRIVVMGDSLSAAYYIPLESGWVNLLRERTAKQYSAPIKVINSSISGATTAAGLQALPVVLEKQKPHLVILELGGNDGLQGKPLRLITSNLEKLIEMSLQAEAKVLLVGMRLPPNLGKRYTEPFFEQYAKLAKKHQLKRVPFLLDGVAGDTALMQGDGIHPRAVAQARILENVWVVLQPALNELFSLEVLNEAG